MKLAAEYVEKPWGRTSLPDGFRPPEPGCRIGELWFAAPDGRELPLLVKYIFTSERLSLQVHPDDVQARARGLAHGKSECWYIVEAEPGASLALGFRDEVARDALRAAALDGSIEGLVDWRPVVPGDFFYVPAGTVHAIGGGIALVEVQQPSDVTYRLYDYGRPRELHLEEALDVADRGTYSSPVEGDGRTLAASDHFTLLRLTGGGVAAELGERQRWAIPLEGSIEAAGDRAGPGECLLVEAGAVLSRSDGCVLLLAATGSG
jgi:mannose-6-phosphate isomerase